MTLTTDAPSVPARTSGLTALTPLAGSAELGWQTIAATERAPAMRVLVARPVRPDPLATVLVAHHRDGIDDFVASVCANLASAGFAVAAPDLFSRVTEPDLTAAQRKARLVDRELLLDLERCHAALPDMGVGSARVGIVGHCMGGRVALLAAVDSGHVDAAVSCYGGTPFRAWGDGEPPGDRIAHVRCPILVLGGREDTNPAPTDLTRLAELAGSAHHPVEVAVVEGAGHAFMNFTRPETFRPFAAQLGYAAAFAFLTRHLAGPVAPAAHDSHQEPPS